MFISISPKHPVPLYQQIVEQVRSKILSGELRAGDPLPSIRELAKDLTISVITTKRAYLELEKEGLIITRPGLGTFVASIDPQKLVRLKRAQVREQLKAAIRAAKQAGIKKEELREMMEALLAEEHIT
ncbi:MAG: GntR family transcriptional regulator [Thermanaeromonas sp.]|uniref:GntR family transcriptional regulator n=1 Tax=Thermanaeromonas sp. TaxID=2003697 RepID=UPI00243E3F79|nr:GntR family transcriptional regulator [Thermanaeromonas sp.]MCG0278407.1 GntR family transcriptional regulator [Thermanaeromonas sp.]